MSNAQISLGGRSYTLAVEPGQESRLKEVAGIAAEALEGVRAATPQLDRDNQLVLAMMMLTDELLDRRSQATAAPVVPTTLKANEVDVEKITAFHNKLAERLERLLAK